MVVHDYSPPGEFVDAVVNSVGPPDPAYFARLASCRLMWRATSPAPEVLRTFRLEDLLKRQ